MYFKIKKHKKKEEGQSVIEFAFILPIFLLLVFGIIDFGWLFYNQISVENVARNAAREACVQYQDIAVDEVGNISTTQFPISLSNALSTSADNRTETQNLLVRSTSSLEGTLMNDKDAVKMTVTYSTDKKTSLYDVPTVEDRKDGDVTVTVQCNMRVLTPVMGIFSDNMTKTLTSSSTFKVESAG